jgi:hypothetical protein
VIEQGAPAAQFDPRHLCLPAATGMPGASTWALPVTSNPDDECSPAATPSNLLYPQTSISATIGPQFSGQFNSWFLDGARFRTNTGNSVWEYSNAAVQKAIVSLPSVENLTGRGNWVWTSAASTPGYPINVYAVGADAPSLRYTATGTAINDALGSGSAIGILDSNGAIRVVDLSGTTPSISTYTPPIREYALNSGNLSKCPAAQNCPFAVNASLQWVAAY